MIPKLVDITLGLRKKFKVNNNQVVQNTADVMKSMREKLAAQGETTGHKKLRSHCNTSHKKMWFPCDFPSCTHLPFHYPTALESHFVTAHAVALDKAHKKVKLMKVSKMVELMKERTATRLKSAK